MELMNGLKEGGGGGGGGGRWSYGDEDLSLLLSLNGGVRMGLPTGVMEAGGGGLMADTTDDADWMGEELGVGVAADGICCWCSLLICGMLRGGHSGWYWCGVNTV